MKLYKMKFLKKINNQNNINNSLIYNKDNYKKYQKKTMNFNQNKKFKIQKT